MSRDDRSFRVLFVCTGNTCRSPMAEALLERLLPSTLRPQVAVASAGTAAVAGSQASPPAIAAAAARGLDLSGHRARRLTRDELLAADLILVMERHHADAARALAPERSDQVALLDEFGREPAVPGQGIQDPIGGSPEIYAECLLRIERHLRRLVPELEARVIGQRRT